MVRMPLEVEIFRNHKHSLTGRLLRKQSKVLLNEGSTAQQYYHQAANLVQEEMLKIAESADTAGHIDASALSDQSADLLTLYLDNQETWQEVCLVLQDDEKKKKTSQKDTKAARVDKSTSSHKQTVVLNRPMSLKLTHNLALLVLYGVQEMKQEDNNDADETLAKNETMLKFLLAFGQECAVYIGGPDRQDEPALLLHGFADVEGAKEIGSGTGLYCGGLPAVVEGVLRGKYRALDFKFFVGRHEYPDSSLDVSVLLGKYQPVACARSLALKQCLSLPKPLWHEVLELCGGELTEISNLELLKRDDIRFQVVDDDNDDDGDLLKGKDNAAFFPTIDDEIRDELDELHNLDDEDEEDY